METIDLTSYRPRDSSDLLEIWRKQGLCGFQRSQPYLLYLWMPETAVISPPPYKTLIFTGPDGIGYRPSANLEIHIKRSDKAKVHSFFLTIGYEVRERGYSYTLKMNSTEWGRLDEVPVDFPDIFPDRKESAYDALFYAYSEFWRGFVRPFVGVRHEELHGDNPELSFVACA